ncbi:hypothetical protein HY798_04725 [Candidatus Falkowbacteria bacterium]|nr:hypothetical protein [Candidatus Falkowbacteria bacterium]
MQLEKTTTKKYFPLFLTVFLVLGNFFIGHYAHAVPLGVSIAQILGHIVSAIIWILGQILTVLMAILIWVAQYNDFIKSPAVINGWVIVRDLCNMFFILILLIIAFATILRIESYNAKKLLPKLLIMAVLINFSKTICGLIIDFAQVIMLTFINGFKEAVGGNLTTMLGIDKILTIDVDNKNSSVTALSIFGSYMLALIYVIISIIVILVMIAVLVMRMVMLWVYVVLSPLAYLLSAFPAGAKYSQQWWSEFSKNVIVGPVLAFFIWLSFVSATTGTGLVDVDATSMDLGTSSKIGAGNTVAGSKDNMIKFIVSIGMLIGGLMVTQQIGGIAGNIAGKGMAAIQKGKGLALKGVGRATGVSYVADVAKSYMAIRKSARDEKIRSRALGITGFVDEKIKQPVGALVGGGFRKITGRWGVKAKEEAKKASQARDEATRLRSNLDNMEGEINDGTHSWNYDASVKQWTSKSAKGTPMTANQNQMELFVNSEEKRLESIATSHNKNADKNENIQKWVDRGLAGAGYGLAAGGALFGAPGLGLAAIPALLNRKQVRNWGKEDINSAASYRSREIDKKRSELKLDSKTDLKNKMDDAAVDSFTRIAAILEGIKKGLFNAKEVERRRDQVRQLSSGDKRVMSQFEAEAEDKGYVSVVQPFKTFSDPTSKPQDKANAEQDIVNSFRDGTYKMSDTDSASLELAAPMAAKGLKLSSLTAQYKNLTDAKQDAFKKGLTLAIKKGDAKAAKALAFIAGLQEAEDAGMKVPDQQSFIKELSYEDIREIVTKGGEKVRALKSRVAGQMHLFSNDVQDQLSVSVGSAPAIKKALNV